MKTTKTKNKYCVTTRAYYKKNKAEFNKYYDF